MVYTDSSFGFGARHLFISYVMAEVFLLGAIAFGIMGVIVLRVLGIVTTFFVAVHCVVTGVGTMTHPFPRVCCVAQRES